MWTHLTNLRRAFNEVFEHYSYIAFASIFAVLAFLFAVWLPNLGLITEIVSSSSLSIAFKLNFILSFIGSISTNFSPFSAGYTIAVAILFGVNVAMASYLLRRKRIQFKRQGLAVGLGGITSGALGVGCAACGSFLLTTILSYFGAAGVLTLLPFRGGEFGIVSIVLLVISLFIISKKITQPLICN